VKRLSEQTLYEILEVAPDASRGAIAAAIQRARTLYGPGSLATYTLMTSEEAAQLGRRIDDAEATLLDERARARYDAELSGAEPPRPIELRPGARAGAAARPGGPRPGDEVDAGRLPPPPEDELPTGDAQRSAPRPPVPGRTPIPLSREAPGAAGPPTPLPPLASGPPVPVIPARGTPAAPPTVSDATSWTGEVLRRLREARGISIDQLSARIKVTRHHIENIEADRFEALPAPVYLRGILLSLSRELRLDGQKVARSYLERVSAGGGAKPR
jgi:curved DNA-binding protein CbpA